MKKFRQENQAFLVEGAKSVQELLRSDYKTRMLFATEAFYQSTIREFGEQSFEVELVSQAELEAAGVFQTNNTGLAIADMKENRYLAAADRELVLVLDEVKDPGNLGTIIRIADWYGISKIVCSTETADCYNPKVIAASMGSFTRVNTYYCDLEAYLHQQQSHPIYGAFLDGDNIHQTPFSASGYLVMGNESRGIREALHPFVNRRVTIPRFGGAESLNVAIATAILCDNLKRQVDYQ